MKRKADSSSAGGRHPVKRRSKSNLTAEEAKQRFRKGLFDKSVLDQYTKQYATSGPYKHAVINKLVDDSLLRNVRGEIRDNVSFTPKETDIYKIHQSGDLANLDGLDDEALAKLPSLLALRDAIYSETFRNYVSHITGCGPLSGRKTDMAINVYTPGCFLLCHDDVIGSRKVSYILYLTDPDKPWKPEWGGALRLFPMKETKGADGQVAKTTLPDVTKIIPPAWNQLSFFAVQPGESFHDVEEVYHAETKKQLEADGGRIRMAISGWFHIPQIGEDGYVEGAEEEQVKNSGLMQLQGNPDQYDRPLPQPVSVSAAEKARGASAAADFDEADLEFLLKYISPTYLTPDTLEQIAEHFDEMSSITLPSILGQKFSARLREYVEAQEKLALPEDSAVIEKKTPWKVARPPHKHRYLYQQPTGPDELRTSQEESPITELLDVFLPSRQFRQWLQLATNCTIEDHDLIARRFRRGLDYTLATGHEGKPRLELNLGFTPTPGWGADEDEDEDEEEEEEEAPSSAKKSNGSSSKSNGASSKSKSKGKGKEAAKPTPAATADEDVGGHEVYMAGDDDRDQDAAIYKTAGENDEDDDNILFFQPAAWNTLTIVLRDSGALKFVKYVSRSAKGDRWDVSGTYEVEEQDGEGKSGEEESSEEEFNGFSDSHDSDSD
ncbi:Pkhd-type hydroxylase tpa1 [Scedosporium apiospermum]|uniref:uS12 prolyl 3,4-dihydroxylase n=1 Tax=Pseudallescheria apiosperma TaxID=563466 RepID=A0A084FY44_PSEDA|nr:Pkhd-type hydroxylase tpa1 [Scedosporium apiospermum]KEZ40006.1 Pkhd-type hydroxylase tpa1 [Scedosporium apiospermum]